MRVSKHMRVSEHRWMAALAVLAVTVAVVGVFIGATAGQPAKPTTLPEPGDEPPPAPEMTEQEMERLTEAAHEAWASPVPVVAGKTLALPEDAIVDALVAKAHQNVELPAGSDLRPLELPVYLIVRDGEMANVSKTNGEFQIGEEHEDKFQFLIDQLGRDRMQLIPAGFYEKRWGPFRDDYR